MTANLTSSRLPLGRRAGGRGLLAVARLTATLLTSALLIAAGLSGCETVTGSGGTTNTRTGAWWVCPPVKTDGLALHGKPCDSNADCAYGHCIAGSFLVGYDASIKICTKNNACVGGESNTTAPCSYDNGGGVTFVSAFEKSKSGGNLQRTSAEPAKICAKSCASDADCSSWNAQTPDCIKNSTDLVSIGTQGVCGVNPFK